MVYLVAGEKNKTVQFFLKGVNRLLSVFLVVSPIFDNDAPQQDPANSLC